MISPVPASAPGTCLLLLCGTLLASCLPLHAQDQLPATAPTSIGTAQPIPSASAVTPGSAIVRWDGHLLQITADGQHLNEVLRDVAARANIRIIGDTPEDRIFGTYGPAPLVDVLADLIDGLSVNMLFVDRSGSRPSDLTFTARNGSATPPSNTGQQQSTPATLAQQQQTPISPRVSAAPADDGSGPAVESRQNNPSAGNPASPNGVKTPQEIFEQLQRLRANAGAQR